VIELNEATDFGVSAQSNAVTPDSEPKSLALPTSPPGEISTTGEAVGRLVHTRNIKGEVSSEVWRITKWNESNGFYVLESGETFYPAHLVLAI
jgi:hypothetical protein